MAIKGYCGGSCGNEEQCGKCRLDQSIPCSPDCENLTQDRKIRIAECLKENCEEVKYIFGMEGKPDREVLDTYGEEAPYPYELI